MTCQCGKGTVYFDHKAKRWRASENPAYHDHVDGPCQRPFPREVGKTVARRS